MKRPKRSNKINLRLAIQDCPGGVTGMHGSVYLDNEMLSKTIDFAEKVMLLDDHLDPLQLFGMYMLCKLYENKFGKITAKTNDFDG